MSKKRQETVEEVPIDKVEDFLNKNFKLILGVVGGLIVVVLVVYLVYQNVQKNKIAKLDNLGNYELSLGDSKVSDDVINQYLKQADGFPEQKNYIYLRIAEIYVGKGENSKAKELLNKVDGNLKELADSLKYDLGDTNVINNYDSNSSMALIWDFRRAISSNNYKSFINKYPDSNLTELLKNWEL